MLTDFDLIPFIQPDVKQNCHFLVNKKKLLSLNNVIKQRNNPTLRGTNSNFETP